MRVRSSTRSGAWGPYEEAGVACLFHARVREIGRLRQTTRKLYQPGTFLLATYSRKIDVHCVRGIPLLHWSPKGGVFLFDFLRRDTMNWPLGVK